MINKTEHIIVNFNSKMNTQLSSGLIKWHLDICLAIKYAFI